MEEMERQQKRRQLEEEREKKRLEEQERLRVYREQLAAKHAEEELRDMESGNYEEVFVEEFKCNICKKTFKNEKQLHNHLQSKKHKDNQARFMKDVTLDPETEKQIKEENERIMKAKKELEKKNKATGSAKGNKEEEGDGE